ncbi:MAG: HpcH/HpaI aldolase/citrate lyase family protein [Candidatus Dormibacteria bacterium]
MRPYRLRRSCLSAPGSSTKMLAKAATLPADQVFLDLEDSVAPLEKVAARQNVIAAAREQDWTGKTLVVRVNAVDTVNCYRDVIEVIEAAGDRFDAVMIPKVEGAEEVYFVDRLLTSIEESKGWEVGRIGLEAQIETAQGLINVDEIAFASDRLETLIFGPGDFAANIHLPQLTVGALQHDYPGDVWHYVLMRILMAARAAGLQAIDGPYAQIKDLDGFQEVARRSFLCGFDGKWALHPGQIEPLNEIYGPTQEQYDRAEGILDAYRQATDVDRKGAVLYGEEMIDEASRKMAEVIAEKGRLAGRKRMGQPVLAGGRD